jgi:hypothetical protein
MAIAGGAVAAGGAVILALRLGDVTEIEEACASGRCPRARETELRARADRAEIMGPAGVTSIVVGLAALGAGLVLWGTARRSVSVVTLGTTLALHGSF